MNPVPIPLEIWVFKARPAVDPDRAAAEWATVGKWVVENNLSGQVWAKRHIEWSGEKVTATITLYRGRTLLPDWEHRDL